METAQAWIRSRRPPPRHLLRCQPRHQLRLSWGLRRKCRRRRRRRHRHHHHHHLHGVRLSLQRPRLPGGDWAQVRGTGRGGRTSHSRGVAKAPLVAGALAATAAAPAAEAAMMAAEVAVAAPRGVALAQGVVAVAAAGVAAAVAWRQKARRRSPRPFSIADGVYL